LGIKMEKISQNAGKVLLEIYLFWKQKNDVPKFEELLKSTKLKDEELKRALKYCHEKAFIDLQIFSGIGMKKMDGHFLIKDIAARGVDIIEKPADKGGNKPFNVTFNFNTDFNIESIIKGEAKLF